MLKYIGKSYKYYMGYKTTKKIQHNYGWTKDKKDKRDLYRNFESFSINKSIDLREKCPSVYAQGKLGSCTANAIAGAYEFDMMKEEEKKIFVPSRLFIYYNERNMEGNVKKDAGAEIRDGIKSINKQGICNEKDWPYDISKFTIKPPKELYKKAQHHKAIKYQRVQQDIQHMKQCLNEGYPFVFGFAVFESFETKEVAITGNMKMPKEEEKILGGHAIMAVGYDEDKKVFIIRNSWGEEWGDKGYFYMPYEFILNKDYCNDFWVIQQVKDDEVQMVKYVSLKIQKLSV